MKGRIYIKEWIELKPYETPTVTDGYYLKLSNEIKEKLISNHFDILSKYFDKKYINILSCFIASYFEDIISETNIWTSFVKLHQEFYNKNLPFYNTDDYYEDEINEQDIRFLFWYFFNTAQSDKFIKSENYFFSDMASDIMEILDEAYEYAPENIVLKKYYEIDKTESDFYLARNLIDTILFKTYLFYPDTLLDLHDNETKLIKDIKDDENIIHYLNENRDAELHKSHTRLLSLTGKQWASKIIGKEHVLSTDFLNISKKIRGYFLYKGQDNNNVFIEHIASSKKFNLTKKSFDHYEDLKEIDTIIFMGIAKWKGEWWFSGICFQDEFNADLILDEKNSMESRMAVNFLDHQTEKVSETLQLQFDAFKDFNNGSQIAFIPSNKIDEFIKKYTEYFNHSLNLTKKESEEAKKRVREDGFFGTDDNTINNYTEVSDTGLVFFNIKSGVEIALAVNSAFPLPENKYFKKQDSTEHIIRLFLAEDISTELAMYCIDNCKAKLPFFREGEGKELLNDIDFLLRFWKKNNYHTVPTITFTGKYEE
ncbi:MAG: hypothetical protein DRJ10_02760 [Bacteroidetes bacterium]|nr:MAG: hypothetical protein DRJ10_02760 [Bacteroidota bacterium]